MEYTEDADRRELLLHSAYDSDTVRAMERPLLDKGVPLMRMAAQAAAHMAAGMLDDEDLALEEHVDRAAGRGRRQWWRWSVRGRRAGPGGRERHRHRRGPVLHEAGFASFVRAGGKVLVLDPAADIPGCASGFSAGEAGERLQTAIAVARKSHLIIDAMTGIGIQGSLRGIPAALASALGLDGEAPDEPALPNRESSGDFPLVLAVDTPSGVGVNDGSLPGPYIPATVTVTFGAMKPCAVLPPATFACGRIELLDFGFDIDDKDPDVEVVDNSFASDAVRLPQVRGFQILTGRGWSGDRLAALPRCRRAHRQRRRPREHRHGPVSGPGARAEHGARRTAGSRDRQGTCAVWVVGSGVPEASVEGTDGDMQRDTIAALLKHYALGSEDENKDAYDMPPIVVDAGALDLLPNKVPGQVVITRTCRRDGETAQPVRNRRQHRGACRFARAVHRRRRALEPVGQREACPRAHRRHRIVEGRGDHGGRQDRKPSVYASGSAPAWLGTAGAGDVLAG